jgi:hypothetical protein
VDSEFIDMMKARSVWYIFRIVLDYTNFFHAAALRQWLRDRVRGAGGLILPRSAPISIAVGSSQFDLAPENLTTLRHFSASSPMNVAVSAGELARTAAPKSASLAMMSGSARAALISLFSA